MSIIDTAKKRYSTKRFNQDKKITTEDFNKVKELLRLSASSVNSQPWHFIIAESDEGKARFAKATQGGFDFNLNKVLKSSHVVAFCAKTDIDDTYLAKLTEQEKADSRFSSADEEKVQHDKRSYFVNLHKETIKDLPQWTAKQTYLSLGSFLLGVADLGLDAVPIEGFDAKIFDEEFKLAEKNLASLALVAVGYRSDDDINAKLPKSRLKEQEIISVI